MKLFFMLFAASLLLRLQCSAPPNFSAKSLYDRIEHTFVSGNLAAAEAEITRVLPRIPAGDAAVEARFQLLHARICAYQGRSSEAVSLLESPVASGDASLQSARYALLSIAYARSGRMPRAQEALSLAGKLSRDNASRSGVYLAEGLLALQQGRLVEAERAFTQSALQVENSPNRDALQVLQQIQSLLNLGVVALRQERYDDALSRFARASALARQIGARLTLEKAAGNAGFAYYKMGDYPRALASARTAQDQARQLGSPIDEVSWLGDAGLSQFRLGDLSGARRSYEESYQLALTLNDSEGTSDALEALAGLALESGDNEGALTNAREARRIAEARGDRTAALQPRLMEDVALTRTGQLPTARRDLLLLENGSAARLSVRWEVEHALARLAAEDGSEAEASHWFQLAIATFREQRTSLSGIEERLPFFENGSTLYLDYVDYLVSEGKFNRALQVLDESRARTLADGFRTAIALHAGAGRKLDSRDFNPGLLASQLGSTILIYSLRPHSSYLWVVNPHQESFFRLPGRETILPLLEQHARSILSARDLLSEQSNAAQDLYAALIKPAEAVLPHGGRVILIADEALDRLNFETLINPAPAPHYWLEDVDVVSAKSLALLGRPARRSRDVEGGRTLLLVGDPVYSDPAYPVLDQAPEEVNAVAGQFPEARRLLLTRSRATPSAYLESNPEHFNYIHFVAHASASETDPLDSALLLSTTPSDGGTGRLLARSILDHPLETKLVTLSACSGAGVRSFAGEGVVGLAWAFLYAGAHNVIGALWDVSDRSTPMLMSSMYAELARGESPEVSLRSAKLSMVHSSSIYRKPYYWAAFQMYTSR